MQDNADTEFTKALKHLSKLPYLIVDVRQNGGGNSWIGDNIAQNLIKVNDVFGMGLQYLLLLTAIREK